MKYVIIAAAVLLLLAAFLYYQNNKIDITRYRLKDDTINDRIKIVHLSDLHSKPFQAVLQKVRALSPDIIFITGDYINDREKNREKMLAFGRELCAVAPVYYITGNHERRLENFETLMQDLEGIGFHVLLDKLENVMVKGNVLSVLGLDENQASFDDYKARRKGTFQYRDMRPYFETLSESEGYKIVLSHYPENFHLVSEMDYSAYDFDLQLSGHAHGGQFILPFVGAVYSPGQGLFPKYAKGSFGEKPMLIVSRGLGNAEFPFRLFNHPEIIVITLSQKIN